MANLLLEVFSESDYKSFYWSFKDMIENTAHCKLHFSYVIFSHFWIYLGTENTFFNYPVRNYTKLLKYVYNDWKDKPTCWQVWLFGRMFSGNKILYKSNTKVKICVYDIFLFYLNFGNCKIFTFIYSICFHVTCHSILGLWISWLSECWRATWLYRKHTNI